MFENKKLLSYIAIGAIVIVAILVVVFSGSKVPADLGAGQTTGGGTSTNPAQVEPPKPKTVTAVDPGTVVPGEGATTTDGVAVPKLVSPAAGAGVSARKRDFDISVQGDKFIPDTIIVTQGDTVNINVTAIDKPYDIYQPDLGTSLILPVGVKKLWLFSPPASGKYTFYCQSCGGPDKGPVGYITSVPK